MSSPDTLLSVVMPAYNEEVSIGEAVQEVERAVLDKIAGSELVVVDDGSTDSTGVVLDKLASANPAIRVVHQGNAGHGPALLKGMSTASGEWLFLVDSDRQIPIEAFEQLWCGAPLYDLILGVRTKRHDPPARLFLTRIIRLAILILFNVRIKDANVPFKVLKRDLWQAAQSCIPDTTLAPSIFLSVYAKRKGYKVKEVAVPHRQRQHGVSTIRQWKLLRFCACGILQLLVFRDRLAT